MVKRAAALGVASVVLGLGCYGAAAATATTTGSASPLNSVHALCSAGYVDAVIGGARKCLRAGEFCSPESRARLRALRLRVRRRPSEGSCAHDTMPSRRRRRRSRSARRSSSHRARRRAVAHRGPRPDRQCSPGAYYSGLTRTVLCSSAFPHRLDPERARFREASGRGRVRDGAEELRPDDRDRPHRLA